MQLVILAGGLGSRISEETQKKPKPLVEICGKPIIVHIMEHYASFGVKEFIICCGYKGEMLKDYFINFNQLNSNLTINLKNNKKEIYKKKNLACFEHKGFWRTMDSLRDKYEIEHIFKFKRYLLKK